MKENVMKEGKVKKKGNTENKYKNKIRENIKKEKSKGKWKLLKKEKHEVNEKKI